jgi:hypothetical protein
MRNENQFLCPVCGYPHLLEPPYNRSGGASYEICPSCGTEFGFDDIAKSFDELRANWVAAGCHWWSSAQKPPSDWSPDQQLANLDKNAQ